MFSCGLFTKMPYSVELLSETSFDLPVSYNIFTVFSYNESYNQTGNPFLVLLFCSLVH